mgnify:CR=1 FL=1
MHNERPRGQLFSDRSAEVVWAGICALDEGAQHEVLRELRRRLGDLSERTGDLNRKVARGVAALLQAAEILGRSPSVHAYRQLRAERPGLELPADGTVRRWLGGDWNGALEQAKLKRVPDVDAAVAPLGPRFTAEELIAAVRRASVELGRIPSLQDYLGWARRPDVRRRPDRLPRSQVPFDRLFGGWRKALVAAQLVGESGAGAPTSRGRGYRYDDAELFAALEEIGGRVAGGFPTTGEFAAERDAILAEEVAAGELPRALPTYGVFVRRFGSWPRTRWAFEHRADPAEGAA